MLQISGRAFQTCGWVFETQTQTQTQMSKSATVRKCAQLKYATIDFEAIVSFLLTIGKRDNVHNLLTLLEYIDH